MVFHFLRDKWDSTGGTDRAGDELKPFNTGGAETRGLYNPTTEVTGGREDEVEEGGEHSSQ